VDISSDDFAEILYRYGSTDQLQYIPRVTRQLYVDVQASLQIISTQNTKYLSTVDPEKVAIRSKASSEINRRILARDTEGTLK